MFINRYKIQLITTLCHVLFGFRISDPHQPGDIRVGSEACFLLTKFYKRNSLSRDRSLLVRDVCISTQRLCLPEWKQDWLPSCLLCKESRVHPWVKWLHISNVVQWRFSSPLWVVTLDRCQPCLFIQLWGKAIPFCQWVWKLSHVHPWNPPLWRFNQVKSAFLVSF